MVTSSEIERRAKSRARRMERGEIIREGVAFLIVAGSSAALALAKMIE